MPIKFSHDADNVLKEAKKQNKPVLLDFSAARRIDFLLFRAGG